MANLSNINNKFIVEDSGDVGIGVTTATTKLHIGGTAPGDSIIRQDSTVSGTNWEIGERAAGKWQIFEDDGDTIVTTFMSTGNVGIGTDSPTQSKLVVIDSADASKQIVFSNNATYYGSISHNAGTGLNEYRTEAVGGHAFYKGTETTPKLTIDSSGNVKIGSSTTGTPALNADDLVIDKGASESGITLISTAAASIRFGDAANTSIGSVEYNHNSNYMRFSTNNAEKMRITSGARINMDVMAGQASEGVIRIGRYDVNTSRYNEIQNSVTSNGAGSYMNLCVHSGTENVVTDVMTLLGSGNVGIGTDSPNPFGWGNKHLTLTTTGINQYVALDIIGTGNAAGAILFGGGNGSGSGTSIGRAQISALDGSNLVFYTNGSNSGASFNERMRIDSNGTVEIPGGNSGIAQSSAKLDVRVNGSGIEFGHANNGDWYFGTVGSYGSAGNPFISFSCMNEQSANTWTTKGVPANIIQQASGGSLQFMKIAATNSTGQSPTLAMELYDGGRLHPVGGIFLGSSNNSNLLDHYEEGNWTPVIAHNDGTGVVPLNVAAARYVRVGDLVYVSAYLTAINPNGNAGGSGSYYGIRGFPFTPENYGAWQIVYASSGITAYGGYSGAASLYFMANGTNGQRSQVHVNGAGVNAWGSSLTLMMNCVYNING